MSRVIARIEPGVASWLASRLHEMPRGKSLTLTLRVAEGGQAVWNLEGPEDDVLDTIDEWQNS